MGDEELRALERRWRESGDEGDEARWLAARVRGGELDADRLRVAARAGHPAALRLVGDAVPPIADGVSPVEWADALVDGEASRAAWTSRALALRWSALAALDAVADPAVRALRWQAPQSCRWHGMEIGPEGCRDCGTGPQPLIDAVDAWLCCPCEPHGGRIRGAMWLPPLTGVDLLSAARRVVLAWALSRPDLVELPAGRAGRLLRAALQGVLPLGRLVLLADLGDGDAAQAFRPHGRRHAGAPTSAPGALACVSFDDETWMRASVAALTAAGATDGVLSAARRWQACPCPGCLQVLGAAAGAAEAAAVGFAEQNAAAAARELALAATASRGNVLAYAAAALHARRASTAYAFASRAERGVTDEALRFAILEAIGPWARGDCAES